MDNGKNGESVVLGVLSVSLVKLDLESSCGDCCWPEDKMADCDDGWW